MHIGHPMDHSAAQQQRNEDAMAFGLHSLLRWFLIFTKPSAEETAKQNLERQGFRVYYPRLLRPALQRGRWVERIVSLFPRYLFVQLDTACQSIAPIRSTTGVTSIVRFGSETTVVHDRIVDSLMRRADPASGLHRLAAPNVFEAGAAVTVVAGAFEGIEGIFEREAGNERVVVLLRLLGRSSPVRIPAGFVVPSRP
jgi:transcriptional antiterminator RfaH